MGSQLRNSQGFCPGQLCVSMHPSLKALLAMQKLSCQRYRRMIKHAPNSVHSIISQRSASAYAGQASLSRHHKLSGGAAVRAHSVQRPIRAPCRGQHCRLPVENGGHRPWTSRCACRQGSCKVMAGSSGLAGMHQCSQAVLMQQNKAAGGGLTRRPHRHRDVGAAECILNSIEGRCAAQHSA